MFRNMRYKERELSREETIELIKSGKDGVLAVHGEDGYPYGVPINYGYYDGKIYIHCRGSESHKLDAIKANPKVCLTVVGKRDLIKEKYTTKYSSAIVFGKAHIISEAEEIVMAMGRMMEGLAPEFVDGAMKCAKDSVKSMVMIEITPEHISGKASK